MNSLVDELAARAEAISEKDRASLVEKILSSLEDPVQSDGDDELERRMSEAATDPAAFLSAEEFFNGLSHRGGRL